MGLLDSISGLLGANGKMPKYDANGLNQVVTNGANEQKGYIGDTTPKLGAVTDTFGQNINGAVNDAQKSRQDTNSAFLKSLDNRTDMNTNQQFEAGKTKILQSVQPAQDSIREALAGSGVGLQGGAAVKQLTAPILQANSQVNDLANQLTNQAQQSGIDATKTLQGQDNSFALQKLGIDQETYNTIMNSDRQDLKDQLNELLGVSGQSTADQLGIAQNAQNAELASAAADNQSRNALLSSLLGIGGTIGGLKLAKAV